MIVILKYRSALLLHSYIKQSYLYLNYHSFSVNADKVTFEILKTVQIHHCVQGIGKNVAVHALGTEQSFGNFETFGSFVIFKSGFTPLKLHISHV